MRPHLSPPHPHRPQGAARPRATALWNHLDRVVPRAKRLGLAAGVIAAGLAAGIPQARAAGTDAGAATTPATAPVTAPRRIVSLTPAFTEAVCMLGACGQLVGVDRFSDWPEQVRALPHLGSLDEVSLEALLRLQPDLVLAAPGGRLVPRLRQAGVTVLTLPGDSLEDIRQMMHTLAQRLSSDGQAAGRWWAQVQARVSFHRQRLGLEGAGTVRPRVYIEVDEALYAAGPKAYLGQLLEALGAANIVPGTLGAFPRLSPEFILRAQPDLIMQMHGGTGLPQRPGWQGLHALQRGRLCQWPLGQVDVLVRPGPRLVQAIDLMAGCLERGR